jgi:hypothetical protein
MQASAPHQLFALLEARQLTFEAASHFRWFIVSWCFAVDVLPLHVRFTASPLTGRFFML